MHLSHDSEHYDEPSCYKIRRVFLDNVSDC
jgi:hypothetical protein